MMRSIVLAIELSSLTSNRFAVPSEYRFTLLTVALVGDHETGRLLNVIMKERSESFSYLN